MSTISIPPVARSPLRGLAAAVAVVVATELAFGWSHVSHQVGIPVPTGIPLGEILDGAVIGILYGFVGFGIILIYRANRIISFAQAGLGSVPAIVAVILITNHSVPYPVALLVMLMTAALFGLIVERVIMRPFRQAPRLLATVATIGVAQLMTLLELKVPAWIAGDSVPQSVTTPLSGYRASIGGVVFSGDHLLIVVVAVGLAITITTFFKRTSLGIAVRASAENADRALLLGIPVARVSTLVWVIAAVCSGAAIFLRAPVVGIPIGGLGLSPAILLYGLGAATIAGMERFGIALGAGMGIGVLEQVSYSGTSQPDLAAGLMLPLILAALLVQRARVSRGIEAGIASVRALREYRPVPIELRRLPEVRIARWAWFALVAVLFLAAPLYVGSNLVGAASLVLIYAIVGVSVVILSGWAGQVSLGQWGFAGVGAAVTGYLATNHGQDFFVCIAGAGVAGALVALVLGLPALRIQGLFLGVVTLAFSATVAYIVVNPDYTSWLLPTGNRIDRPIIWSRLDVTGQSGFYYVVLVFLVLAVCVARGLRQSRSGRIFVASRDNARASQSYAVNTAATRLAAFAISGFLAAVAGALFAYQQGAVDKDSFGISVSIGIFAFVVVGGLTSVPGAIAGAVYFEGLLYIVRSKGLAGLDTLGLSSGILTVLTFLPGGFAEAGYGMRDALLRRVARRRDLLVPSLVADRGDVPVTADVALPALGAATSDAGSPSLAPSPETRSPAPADALLVCRGVDVAYDHVQVLFGVDMHVRRGEVLALLGTNGAGKSTLLRAISGLTPTAAGTITVDGLDITHASPAQRARQGIVQVPGGRGVFPTLTVAEHLRMAAWLVDDAAKLERARQEMLTLFPRLRDRLGTLGGDLSGGEAQQLAVGMAFLCEPRLLIIDELSLGLAPVVVEQLLRALREMNRRGTTILIVEQSVNVALTVAQRAYFMEKGEVRFEGPTSELLERDDIVRSVFLEGAAGGPSAPAAVSAVVHMGPASEPPADPILRLAGLSVAFGGVHAVDGVDLDVAEREIVGIIGPNGAGKTTLFDLVSGHLRATDGQVLFRGADITRWAPHQRAWVGMGRSFQDARIFPSLTVAENIATALERHLTSRDHVAAALNLPDVRALETDVAWTVSDLIELMNLEAFRDKFVRELSTGSRRVVDLAMAMAHEPSVLLLDEPSSGIAQREAEALAPLLRRIRAETGCAMLVIEHDMPLVTSVSDRLVALELGRIIACGLPEEVIHDPRVVASYLGTDEAAVRRSDSATPAALVESLR